MALPLKNTNYAVLRIRIWYGALLLVFGVFGLRLFYVQVIQYNHYKHAALSDQLKQYQIPATRGVIRAYDRDSTLPIVLNQQLYTLYADPVYIKNADKVAGQLAPIIGGSADDYKKAMSVKDTRYAVLAHKLSADQKKRITALKSPGLGLVAQDYRTYPQGSLAAQVLGFVSNDGTGEYGIEEALNKQLTGTPGELKAITDINGIPLAASKDNTQKEPQNGKDVVLTIDVAMQQQLENILATGVKSAKAPSGSAIIMDPTTGAVKAMANVPSYNPAEYYSVEDSSLFLNAAVSNSIEVGSIMKPLTTAAALDQGVISPTTTYYDPAFWTVDGFKITNIEEDGGAGTKNLTDVLNLSLNTGATWELMQMGGGQINLKARQAWYDYLSNYQFGKYTGIEQGYEDNGYVPKPADNGAGIDLTYANTTFGQAMTATPIQVAGALSAMVNGGTYYKPHLVDETIAANGVATKHKPVVTKAGVVKPSVASAVMPLMEYTVQHHNFSPSFDPAVYSVGGKTGTAQIANKANGKYYDDQFNGTYMGYVGGASAQYVIVVFVEKPTVSGYAGTAAAQPIFGSLAHMLINNSYVTPK